MWFQNFLVAQFFVYIFMVIINVCILTHWHPYKFLNENRRDTANEVLIMLIMYHMFAFNDFVPDPIVRYNLGYSCLAFLGLHLLANLVLITIASCRNSRRKFVVWRALRRNKHHGHGINVKAVLARIRASFD